ncbi:MAG: DUF4340 domain-containing protein [Rhodothalassiaceae bacterium]
MMSERQTTILGFLTLTAVLAAIWVLFGETGPDEAGPRNAPLYPDLARQINEVQRITIASDLNTTTLTRKEGVWVIAEKGGYPANAQQLGRLFGALIDARIVRQTTRNPDLYERIGLGDKAVRLSLFGDAGKPLLTLHIGDRSYRDRRFETYVRRDDEAVTYVVADLPEVRAEASTWLPPTLLDIAQNRVARIRITHPDGEHLLISRPAPDADFTLAGVKESEQLKGFRPLDPIAMVFTTMGLRDVRPAAEIAGHDPLVQVHMETFDGLAIDLDLVKTGDETGDAWATLKATYTPPESAGEGPKVMPDAPKDGAAEAAQINARTDGWAFRLPSSSVISLARHRADLVEEKPAADAADGGADGGSNDGGS